MLKALSMKRLILSKQAEGAGSKCKRNIHTVVLIRHGESVWNKEKRFTGWCDVPLTEHGEHDATDAGHLMGERGIKFDVAFTSTLERAWRTCALALASAGQSHVEVVRSWKLNERHYGALQGYHKNDPTLLEAFGEEKIIEWRRSYHTAPPSLYDQDFLKHIGTDCLLKSSMHQCYFDPMKLDWALRGKSDLLKTAWPYPSTESLKECEDRAFGFWKEEIAPRVKAGERVLICAHANTIRALVKSIDNISDDMIPHLKIPNGVPLVYTLDKNLEPKLDLTDDLGFQAKYLVSARNHKKMMSYERCVRKKLRSLFEYLDTDKDGRITPACLTSGLSRLLNYENGANGNSSSNNNNGGGVGGGSSTYDVNKIATGAAAAANSAEGLLLNADGTPGYYSSTSTSTSSSGSGGYGGSSSNPLTEAACGIDEQLCEFEIEELLRCVPSADERGGVTLQAFLEAEATLLPTLSRLRLLE